MRGNKKQKWKRFLIRAVLIISVIIILLIIVASPLVRYLVQKYDVQLTGREITLGRTFINPVTGSVGLNNIKVFEAESDSVFVSAKKFSADLSILKLIAGTYDISSVKLNNPEIHIIRDDTIFNFSDLIERFAVAEDTVEKEVLKLNIRNIRIRDGIVHYREKKMPVNLTISEINFSSPGMFWDVDSINGTLSLVPGGGEFSGDFMFRPESMDYRVSIDLSDFNPELFGPYFEEMAGQVNISALINIDLRARGNLNQLMKGWASGNFRIDDFHFGSNPGHDFMSADRLLVQFREIDLAANSFYFDSILIDKPYVLYQVYDTLDNFRRMFRSFPAKEAGREESADTVDSAVDMTDIDYYVRSFVLNDGKIEFNDYSIAEKFSIAMDPFNIKSDTINKADSRIKIIFDGKLKPYGNLAATLSINPENEENFDFSYEFRNIAASMFNPYIASYSSYQLDRGTIEMHGTWTVKNANINALNHFLVIDPQDTKRVRGKDTKWIPLPLIMSFVRERGSVIDYQIPVKGNLADPGFKIWDVISDMLRNILVKPPTTPYRLQVQNVENKIEKSLTVRWKMRQHAIEDGQEKFMKSIAAFLKDNPEAYIVVQPVFHEEKEKENILLFEAKKKYFFLDHKKEVTSLSENDSMQVEKLSSKDPAFIRFLNNAIKNPELLTLQEKCYRFIGRETVDNKYQYLIEKRRDAFLKYFRDEKTDNRVEIAEIKNQVPYNWFSYYDINYKGDIPESLSEAFGKLYEINSKLPRSEYFEPPKFKR